MISKTILIIVLLQLHQIVILEEYYKGEGVIFDSTVEYPFDEDDILKRYNPNIEQLKKGEDFLFANYYDYNCTVQNHLNGSDVNIKFAKPQVVRNKFKHHNRQYLSYITNQNDTILFVALLNFRNKRFATRYFGDWKERVSLGFGDIYYKNQEYYIINLTKNKFIYKVVGMESQ